MTVKLTPSAARNARASAGTIVSPDDQLLPANRGISLPSAFCSVSLSGKRIRTCMDEKWNGFRLRASPAELLTTGEAIHGVNPLIADREGALTGF